MKEQESVDITKKLYLNVYDKDYKVLEKVEINKEILEFKYNKEALFKNIIYINSNKRQSTAKTKSKAEVSGTGKKPWRQKGSGNARHGSRRSPQWIKGGVVFGPTPERNYKFKLNKKERKIAWKSAWQFSFEKSKIIIASKIDIKKPSTKFISELKNKYGIKKRVTFVTLSSNKNLYLSCRNLQKTHCYNVSYIESYSILNNEFLIISKDVLEHITKIFLNTKKIKKINIDNK